MIEVAASTDAVGLYYNWATRRVQLKTRRRRLSACGPTNLERSAVTRSVFLIDVHNFQTQTEKSHFTIVNSRAKHRAYSLIYIIIFVLLVL